VHGIGMQHQALNGVQLAGATAMEFVAILVKKYANLTLQKMTHPFLLKHQTLLPKNRLLVQQTATLRVKVHLAKPLMVSASMDVKLVSKLAVAGLLTGVFRHVISLPVPCALNLLRS